jgi:hypothetical protein
MRLCLHPVVGAFGGIGCHARRMVAYIDRLVGDMARLRQFALRNIVRNVDRMIGAPLPAPHGFFGVCEIDGHGVISEKEIFRRLTFQSCKAFRHKH